MSIGHVRPWFLHLGKKGEHALKDKQTNAASRSLLSLTAPISCILPSSGILISNQKNSIVGKACLATSSPK